MKTFRIITTHSDLLAVQQLAVDLFIGLKQERQLGDAENLVKVSPNAIGLKCQINCSINTALYTVCLIAVGQLV